MVCDYGCGKIGKYKFKNGKWCCEKYYQRCPENKTDPWNKGKIGVYSEDTLERMRRRNGNYLKDRTYDEVYGIEKSKKLREESSKRMTKYNKKVDPWNKGKKGCFNSETIKKMRTKANERWDDPRNRLKLSETIRKKTPKDIKANFDKYKEEVCFLTENNVRIYRDKIKNIEIRGDEFHLDHKYSIKGGFENNVEPEIIASFVNLQILSSADNCKKYTKCSISLNDLKILYNKRDIYENKEINRSVY